VSLDLRPVGYDDPAAEQLVAAMGEELTRRYGDGGLSPAAAHEFGSPGLFLVADLAGRPVGCAGLRPGEDGIAEVKRMYVEPDVRGRGVARALLRALVAHAREVGLSRLRLETGTEQPEAVALYESEGWSPTAPFGHYADDPRTRCYELRL
jgi:GNAT superfamily N-acetyltransferase